MAWGRINQLNDNLLSNYCVYWFPMRLGGYVMNTLKYQKKSMSVKEMGQLLGLKKTESYYLVKKNYFKTVVVGQKIRVMVDSFEAWYANQFSYQKVDGTPPGEQLKKSLLSRAEIAELLEVSVATVYEIEKKAKFDYVNIYGKQRILKESFDNWYCGQNRYKTKEDKKKEEILLSETLSMPELARKIGIPRERVYALVNKKLFEIVMVGTQKRITRNSYESWLKTKAAAGGK